MASAFSSIKQGLTEVIDHSEGKLKKAVVHEFGPLDVKAIRAKVGMSQSEFALLDSVESGAYESTLTDSRRKELEAAAANTFRKDKRINIRISNRDLIAVQARAAEEGIPYQTLVSSIIHKYLSGSLRDIAANKKRQSDA